MEIFKNLIGNDDIKNTLGSAIKNRVFSHAYIIEGDYGTGKHTVARLASSAIMCQGNGDLPCGKCDFCRKILKKYLQSKSACDNIINAILGKEEFGVL